MKRLNFLIVVALYWFLLGSIYDEYSIGSTGYYKFVISKKYKIPVLTRYKNTPNTLIHNVFRYRGKWWQCSSYSVYQATNNDYKHSGYDR